MLITVCNNVWCLLSDPSLTNELEHVFVPIAKADDGKGVQFNVEYNGLTTKIDPVHVASMLLGSVKKNAELSM